MKHSIKAPQKSLKTSWVHEAFTKAKKAQIVVKRSLSGNGKPIFRTRDGLVGLSNDNSY
jgi:hypothetical protein